MIITHRITEDGNHALSAFTDRQTKESIGSVCGSYTHPLFLYTGAQTYMALSAHFGRRAGVYQIISLTPDEYETKTILPMVAGLAQKQEYDYGS
jgi:hypothetical protein